MNRHMTEKKKREIYNFKKFLVANHALSSYITSIESDENFFIKDFGFMGLRDFFEKRVQEDFLCYAFDWSHTSQGHNFWSSLNIEWQKQLTVLRS